MPSAATPCFGRTECFLQPEAFPLTARSKILKRGLVEMVRQGELAPEPIRFRLPKEVA